jgi:hypothetical protein
MTYVRKADRRLNYWGGTFREKRDPPLQACVEACEHILATYAVLPLNAQAEARQTLTSRVRSLGMSFLVTGEMPAQIVADSALYRLVKTAGRDIRAGFKDRHIPVSATPFVEETNS